VDPRRNRRPAPTAPTIVCRATFSRVKSVVSGNTSRKRSGFSPAARQTRPPLLRCEALAQTLCEGRRGKVTGPLHALLRTDRRAQSPYGKPIAFRTGAARRQAALFSGRKAGQPCVDRADLRPPRLGDVG
jgi:hypothetical protein